MARILSIQSQVIYGHVGNSAAAFALERLSHEVLALPTIILPHHPGHGRAAGRKTEPGELDAWLEDLAVKGWLDQCDAVLTGYFPDAKQIPAVAEAIAGMRKTNPQLLYLCDPVFGDEESGVFLPESIARAIKQHLFPLADLATPNAFELAELTGAKVEDAEGAMAAAGELGLSNMVITSVPVAGETGAPKIGTLAWQRPGDWRPEHRLQKNGCWLATVPRQEKAPHGTGDLFAALLLGHLLNQVPLPATLRQAAASVSDLAARAGALNLDELPLTAAQGALVHPSTKVTLTPLGTGTEGQWVAGVDDCPEGWLVVMIDLAGRKPSRYRLCKTFAEVLALEECPSVIAVDVPIGLPEIAARGGRPCDTAARALLGSRRSTVLTPPARAALAEDDFHQACEVNLKNSVPPRKVSKHTFGIFPRIREVNEAVAPQNQGRIFECQPEVGFWAMNGKKPVPVAKRVKNVPHGEGLAFRRSLLAANGFEVRFIASFDMPRAKAGQEDFLDACACAWTAARIAKGEALRVPADPGRDARGLRMEIWG